MHDRGSEPPFSPHSRRRSALDGIVMVFVVAFVLLVSQGQGITSSANEMQPGVERSILLAVGKPAGWIAGHLPFAQATSDSTRFLSPDGGDSGSAKAAAARAGKGGGGQITARAFDPVTLGEPAPKLPKLTKLLVTGDSMSMPLDALLARRFAGAGVRTDREPHIGTGISKSDLLDWTTEAFAQAAKRPQAIVVFIGANEGFPMRGPDGRNADCCGPAWAAAYANRVRTMMDAYTTDPQARVYWISVPTPRDPARQKIERAVNAAVRVAAVTFGAQVRLIDINPIFSPDGRFHDSIVVGGADTLVRRSDGIHLNDRGAAITADLVEKAIKRDFGP